MKTFGFLVGPGLTCSPLLLLLLPLIGNITAVHATCQNVIAVESTPSLEAGAADDGLEKELMKSLPQDCFNMTIPPGNYTITRFFSLDSANIFLHGAGQDDRDVYVTFDVPSGTYNPYALYFANSDTVEISGIKFEYSPGVIGFENVTKVVIKDSSFRLGVSLTLVQYYNYCILYFSSFSV